MLLSLQRAQSLRQVRGAAIPAVPRSRVRVLGPGHSRTSCGPMKSGLPDARLYHMGLGAAEELSHGLRPGYPTVLPLVFSSVKWPQQPTLRGGSPESRRAAWSPSRAGSAPPPSHPQAAASSGPGAAVLGSQGTGGGVGALPGLTGVWLRWGRLSRRALWTQGSERVRSRPQPHGSRGGMLPKWLAQKHRPLVPSRCHPGRLRQRWQEGCQWSETDSSFLCKCDPHSEAGAKHDPPHPGVRPPSAGPGWGAPGSGLQRSRLTGFALSPWQSCLSQPASSSQSPSQRRCPGKGGCGHRPPRKGARPPHSPGDCPRAASNMDLTPGGLQRWLGCGGAPGGRTWPKAPTPWQDRAETRKLFIAKVQKHHSREMYSNKLGVAKGSGGHGPRVARTGPQRRVSSQ